MSIYGDMDHVEDCVKGTKYEEAFNRIQMAYADLERHLDKLERVSTIIENLRDLHLPDIKSIMLEGLEDKE